MAERKSGSFVVNNNIGAFTVPIDADQLTDGNKTLTVQIRKNSVNGPVIGTLTSAITVQDTSFTPAGTLIRTECRGVDKWGIYANGSGGTYDQLIQANSSDCGYNPPSTAITRQVNWSPANGSLGLFVVNGNFTGWMGDITKSNLQVDSAERNTIVNDPLMRQKINELISYVQNQFGVTISQSSIDAELNAGIDSYNSIIDSLGSNTSAIYLLTATPKLTNQNSFVSDGKIYTRTTLKYSAINFGFTDMLDANVSAEDITTALVAALNNNGITVNSSERTQIKNIVVVIIQLLINFLNSINDPVNLYDYTEQPV